MSCKAGDVWQCGGEEEVVSVKAPQSHRRSQRGPTADVIWTWKSTAAADELVISRQASGLLMDDNLTARSSPSTPDLYFETRRAGSGLVSHRGQISVCGHVYTVFTSEDTFAVFRDSD